MKILLDWVDTIGTIVVAYVDKYSFEAFLIVGLVALILSLFGFDKGKKAALLSPAIYMILQIFLSAWFGV